MNSFNIGLSGLKAAQVGLDVTAHNVANVNTPYFRRQVVSLEEVRFNYGIQGRPDGGGVAVSAIKPATTFNPNFNNTISDKEYYNKLNDGLSKLDSILNNPDLNVSANIEKVFNAMNEVANNPTSIEIRENALNAIDNLVTKTQFLNSEIDSLNVEADSELNASVAKVNQLLETISKYNQFEGDSNSIAQKQSAIFELSEYLEINVSQDGKSILGKNGLPLVQNNSFTPISLNQLSPQSGGKIGAILELKNNISPQVQNNIGGVVNEFSNLFNNQISQGFDLNGNPGQPIFNITGNDLSTFSANPINPREIGASTFSMVNSWDGTNAQTTSELRYLKIDNQTISEKLSSINQNIGFQRDRANGLSNFANNIYDQNNPFGGLSDVNLEEEAVNLLKYQRMFEVNSKVIQTANEMLGTLLNIKA